MGLIRRIASTDESNLGYEVTSAGMQFIAGHDDVRIRHETDGRPRNVTPELRSDSATFTSQEAIALLNSLKVKAFFEQALMARVSILIPALNEAENIKVLLNNLASILPSMAQVTVVDGGSSDATANIAKALGARIILQKGTGKGRALRQAFNGDHAGDIVVIMDADGSNRTEEIPVLIAAIVNGADIAKGSRFLKGGGSTDLSFIRKIGNKFFLSIVNHAWSAEYTDLCYGFMAFKRDPLKRLVPLLKSRQFQIEVEICIRARRLGMKVVEMPSIELKRRHGVSKLNGVRDSIRIAKTILGEALRSLQIIRD
ncbi:MAG: glycosyltransferase family 2 protein [Candidatus Bathyarchaeia archaeon]